MQRMDSFWSWVVVRAGLLRSWLVWATGRRKLALLVGAKAIRRLRLDLLLGGRAADRFLHGLQRASEGEETGFSHKIVHWDPESHSLLLEMVPQDGGRRVDILVMATVQTHFGGFAIGLISKDSPEEEASPDDGPPVEDDSLASCPACWLVHYLTGKSGVSLHKVCRQSESSIDADGRAMVLVQRGAVKAPAEILIHEAPAFYRRAVLAQESRAVAYRKWVGAWRKESEPGAVAKNLDTQIAEKEKRKT
jgi:hypothetical protein